MKGSVSLENGLHSTYWLL